MRPVLALREGVAQGTASVWIYPSSKRFVVRGTSKKENIWKKSIATPTEENRTTQHGTGRTTSGTPWPLLLKAHDSYDTTEGSTCRWRRQWTWLLLPLRREGSKVSRLSGRAEVPGLLHRCPRAWCHAQFCFAASLCGPSQFHRFWVQLQS